MCGDGEDELVKRPALSCSVRQKRTQRKMGKEKGSMSNIYCCFLQTSEEAARSAEGRHISPNSYIYETKKLYLWYFGLLVQFVIRISV